MVNVNILQFYLDVIEYLMINKSWYTNNLSRIRMQCYGDWWARSSYTNF